MADIKQAAKWLQDGESIKRSAWEKLTIHEAADECGTLYICSDNDYERIYLDSEDLLADDWEIAE